MTKEELKEEAEGFAKRTYLLHQDGLNARIDGYIAGAEPREEKIAILEKENAELKEQNIKDCENFNKTVSETKKQWNKEHYQLAKAKEIIKELLDTQSQLDPYRDIFKDRILKAEQFLNEVEK